MHYNEHNLSTSLLTPYPQFVYVEKYDCHLCYWNGFMTTRRYAMLTYQSRWLNIYPTDTSMHYIFEEFKRYYLLGIFGDSKWDGLINNHTPRSFYRDIVYRYLDKEKVITKLVEKVSKKDALMWFLDDNVMKYE